MRLRLLLWTAAASAPALLAVAVVYAAPGAAGLAAVFVVVAAALLLYPVARGLADIGRAVATAEADDGATPAVRSRSPAIEELWLGVARLLRAERQKRRELGAELAAARAILAAIPDPILLLDERRRIRTLNEAAGALFGEAVRGHDLGAALRQPPLLDAADKVLRGGASRLVELAHGQRRFVAHVAATGGRGAEIAAVVALSDVTALKRSDEMRADFVANASHELRTPLATLSGFIETLRGPARDDPAAREKFLGIMQAQAGRMARLVDDLLSLSRIEMREHVKPTGTVALPLLLRVVAEALELRARERGMRIEIDAPETLPPVLGDADELAQLFQNLVDNAIKYGSAGGPIRVTASPAPRAPPGGNGAVAVAVRDEGEGIAREHLPRLTERFYRIDAARSREVGGTGLGLAIVKHIVARHRGTLEIDSRPGEGSTFTVLLPTA